MAGYGPEPNEQRRRRNTPAKVAKQVSLPASGRKGTVPKIPGHIIATPELRELWRTWWRSPQATQWHTQTVKPILGRLLALHDQEILEGPEPRRSSEMRQLEQNLGLSPKGMRDLCWVIVADADLAEEPAPKKKAAPKAKKAAPSGRRGRVLSLVEADTATGTDG